MRYHPRIWAGLLVWALASPALAGIMVTSYQTLALTNAFAPLSQTEYFAQHTLVNVSPALAEVSGDWMGTNSGGSTNTWHFVGQSSATSTTTFNADTLTVTASGSFAYEINTTAEFVDPRSSDIYSPSGAANYEALFNTDVPMTYMITAQLNQRGRVRLSSFNGEVVLDVVNPGPAPLLVDRAGTIPAGHYDFLASTSLIASNLPNGINHYARSGGFGKLIFTVQVPEPSALAALIGMLGMILRGPRRCVCTQ